jgi:iron complex transport system ATP-binding protein
MTVSPTVSPSLAFDIRALEVNLGGRRVVGPLDLQIPEGAFVGVLGPNGSGKTTFLKALSGVARPAAGEVLLRGTSIRRYSPVETARMIGVVPQQFSLDFGFTVAEMVAMGRYAHAGRGLGRDGGGADEAAVEAALGETTLTSLSARPVTELSGGERQRALIAQTLAQETPIILLDEPLNNLDLNHQLEVMQLLTRLHKAGRTIVVVLHDLNIAAQYCETLVLLDGGRVAAQGPADVILDPRVILEVFRVRVAVHRQGARPYLTPLWTNAHETGGESRVKVHVMAGGGAASSLVEELVLQGFTPSVGVVSVFDSDYVTAGRYELEVVSAPPFQAFPPEAVAEMESLVRRSDVLVVAPVFFAPGNMDLLRVAVEAAGRGQPVILVDADSIEQRDLTEGRATALMKEALQAGAQGVTGVKETVAEVRKLAAGPSPRP